MIGNQRRSAICLALMLSSGVCRAQQYVISRVAGGGAITTSIPPAQMPVSPAGLLCDKNNNLYFTSGNSVYILSTSGTLTRIAGKSQPGFSGDGGAAVDAQLNLNFPITTPIPVTQPQSPPIGLALDSLGNLFIADFGNNRIRRISPNGIITTIAGTGTSGFSGDGGPAVSAELDWPEGVAVDGNGNLFVSDTWNNRIREISPQGIIATIAGTGVFAISGDGGPAIRAQLAYPGELVLDSTGNLYELEEHALRKIGPGGIINSVSSQTLATGFAMDTTGNFYLASYVSIEVLSPSGAVIRAVPPVLGAIDFNVALDSSGNMFIAELANSELVRVDTSGKVTTVAGTGSSHPVEEDNVPAAATQLDPDALAVDGQGSLFVSESNEHRVRKISNGVITTVAGGNSPVGGEATSTPIGQISQMAADSNGNLFLNDFTYGVIWRLTPAGVLTTYATVPYQQVFGLAIDQSGNVFYSETQSVVKLSPDGTMTTIAGAGGPSGTTQVTNPGVLTTDSDGNLFVSSGNGIWKISGTGSMAQVASGNFSNVAGIACDRSGNIFLALFGQIIEMITPVGKIVTVAGNGQFGATGDGGLATSAQLWNPSGLVFDGTSGILIADNGSGEIRRLSPTSTPVIISAVVDAASEQAEPLSPGKIVAIYGAGLGPANIAVNQPANGAFGKQVAGTGITFNGFPAAMYYTSAGQAAAIVPYEVTGMSLAQVVVTSASGISQPFTVRIAPSAPSFFSENATGSGQISAQNQDYSLNTAANPAAINSYITLYATGEGQLTPAGSDGQLASAPYPKPVLPVQLTIGGIAVVPAYAGSAPTEIEGLMQINAQIPPGVQPGGYVPVVLMVGGNSNPDAAAWISVSAN